METFKVVETFVSINGEGKKAKQGITPLNTTASIIMYANNLSSKFCASLRKIGNEIKNAR